MRLILKRGKIYKELFLTMWANCEYLNTSFVGQYLKADCDVIAVAMAKLKVLKKNLISVFANYQKNIFRKFPKSFNKKLQKVIQ